MIINTQNHLNQEYKELLPKKGRIMAIDVGQKRLGIAVSDETRIISNPKLIINRQSNESDFKKIKDFIDEYQPSAIVIGRPINMNEEITEMTIFSENFAKNLDIFLEERLPIFLFEERLSSFEAKEIDKSGISKRKGKYIDDIAASVILEHFLQSEK